MPKFAEVRRLVRRLVLSAAVAMLALPALAQEMPPPGGELPDPFANFDCAAEPVTGSGPGFTNSRDASEDAARKGWGEKAIAIYPEATWETAKEAGVSCVVQGLYSKCFAQGIPCRPKSDGANSDGANSDDAGSDEASSDEASSDEAAQAPKAE